MRILIENNWAILLMKDGHYFELELPDNRSALKLKSVLELAIADTIEELQAEGDPNGPLRGDS